jgi:hypothetical protein
LTACVFFAVAIPAAAEVEIRATLEPDVIGIDETALFTVEVQGGGFGNLHLRPDFELENFEIVGGPFQHEDLRFGNRQWARSFRLSWQLRPLAVGRARVRSLSIAVRGETVSLPDREVRVQEEPTGRRARGYAPRRYDEPADPFGQLFGRRSLPWNQPKREEPPGVFLRAEVHPQRPVVGQQVLYTVHLYTREDITSISPSDVPTFRGFWVRDIPVPQHLPTEMVEIDGRRYGRVVLLQKALFPLRPGRHELEPTRMDLTLRLFERRFFGPPISRPERAELETEVKAVDVQPLPVPPPGFAGAVGRLEMAARLEPRELRLGEAATLTVTLSGEGNLHGVQEPQVETPAGLTVFPPQQGSQDHIVGTTIRGARTWSFVVVPDRAGRYTVETPEIVYFDPGRREYRVATAPAMELTARPKVAVGDSGSGEPHGIRAAAFGTAGRSSGRDWTRLLPWLFALPWGLALVVTLVRRRSGPAASAETAARPTPASRQADRRLEERLAQAAAETRPRQAAARIEEAWREFLAERWEISPSVPASRWSGELAAQGADREAAEEAGRLVDDLQYLRQAPQLCATDSLCGDVVARCRRLVRRLR